MIRVVGNTELYVDVDWPTRTVRVLGPDKASLLWLTPSASAEMRAVLQQCEWELEGVPDAHVTYNHFCILPIPAAGQIAMGDLRFSAVQSEHLRTLLVRAETVLHTGVGDMDTP